MSNLGLEDVLQKSLFEVSELEGLSEEEKADVFQKAYETVMNRVMLRVADQLDEEGLDKLKELIDAGDAGAVQSFFEEKGIDIDQIATTESLAYKVEMASISETLRGQHQSN